MSIRLAEHYPYYGYGSQGSAHDAPNPDPLVLRCIAEMPEPGSSADQACDNAREYADLRAQQDMVRVAWIQAIVGGVGLVGLAYTVIFAGKAWQEAQRGANIAERAFLESDRPEFVVKTLSSTLTESLNDGLIPTVLFELKNTGGRAAFVTQRKSAVMILPTGTRPPIPNSSLGTGVLSFSPATVPPEETIKVHANREEWRPEEIEALRDWKSMVYVAGYLAYTDKVGGLWERGFTLNYIQVQSLPSDGSGPSVFAGVLNVFGGEGFNFDRPRRETKQDGAQRPDKP